MCWWEGRCERVGLSSRADVDECLIQIPAGDEAVLTLTQFSSRKGCGTRWLRGDVRFGAWRLTVVLPCGFLSSSGYLSKGVWLKLRCLPLPFC